MDKLQKYNQRLLAIIGTIVIVMIAVLLLIGVFVLIFEIIDANTDVDRGVQIVQTDAEADSTIIIRRQQISLDDPYQLDSTKSLYLIPIGQVNLKNAEEIEIESGGRIKFASSNYEYKSYYGNYNNFILTDFTSGASNKIFINKVVITKWAYLRIQNNEILIFKGSDKDSNKDNILGWDDFHNVYVYYLDEGVLKDYVFDKKTVIDFEGLNKTNLISVRVGIDKNEDYEFDRDHEPQDIYVIDVETKDMNRLVSDELMDELQMTLDK